MNELTLGIAVGRLTTRGRCVILVDGEQHEIILSGVPKTLLLSDLILLLNAEEVVV